MEGVSRTESSPSPEFYCGESLKLERKFSSIELSKRNLERRLSAKVIELLHQQANDREKLESLQQMHIELGGEDIETTAQSTEEYTQYIDIPQTNLQRVFKCSENIKERVGKRSLEISGISMKLIFLKHSRIF